MNDTFTNNLNETIENIKSNRNVYATGKVTKVNYVESGKRRPSPEIAIKIAKVLDFDWTIFYKPVKKIKIQ